MYNDVIKNELNDANMKHGADLIVNMLLAWKIGKEIKQKSINNEDKDVAMMKKFALISKFKYTVNQFKMHSK